MFRLAGRVSVLLAVVVSPATADEKPLDVSLKSLALFKNGMACAEYVSEIPGAGTYRIEGLPDAIHGTFWVESDAQVAVRTTRRMVDVKLADLSPGEFQKSLVGREVNIRFKEPHLAEMTGEVVSSGEDRTWSRVYESNGYGWWPNNNARGAGVSIGSLANEAMLAIETKEGLTYLKASSIASIHVPGGIEAVASRRPVVLVDASTNQAKPASLLIRLLTKGVAWAPSYQVDVSDPANLVIRQTAVVRNELVPICDVEIRLISGFPSVRFANVTSPMSNETTWSQFLQQLSQRSTEMGSNRAVMTQAVAYNTYSPQQGIDLSAIPAGEGSDLHYQSIGRRTLDVGDSLTLQTSEEKARYERIVEWIVPDQRNEYGQLVSNRGDNNDDDVPWDALRFRNPLGYPMTTAPAMIVSGDRFLGQQISHWANVGEQATLRITKALSIRTVCSEHEVEGERERYDAYGRSFRKAKVEAEVRANNHRNEKITLVIRKRFSGELISAEGEPKTQLREEGVWSINPRYELIWTVDLAPGEEIRFPYSYSVLAG